MRTGVGDDGNATHVHAEGEQKSTVQHLKSNFENKMTHGVKKVMVKDIILGPMCQYGWMILCHRFKKKKRERYSGYSGVKTKAVKTSSRGFSYNDLLAFCTIA